MHLPSPQGNRFRLGQGIARACFVVRRRKCLALITSSTKQQRKRRKTETKKKCHQIYHIRQGSSVYIVHTPLRPPQSRFGTATRRRLLCIKCQVCLELAELSGLPKSSFSNCGPCCSCCCCCAVVVVACFSLIFISFYFFLSCLLYFAFNNIFTLMLGHFGQRAAPHFLCVFMCRITEVDNLILCTEGLPVCTPLSSVFSSCQSLLSPG